MIYIISRGITLNKFCILEKMVFIFEIFCVFTLIFESRPSFADFNFDFIFCSFRDKVTTERAAISRIWTNFKIFCSAAAFSDGGGIKLCKLKHLLFEDGI